jgi:uncharacterized repeat protein (TIGR01451 family)/LPXTG-motif cell wall-anchored protein
VLISGTAHAQTATLGLTKSVSLNPPQIGPGQNFTYFLSYSCSSLSTDCAGAQIVDVLPPQLSRLITDVKLQGNFKAATYDPNTGTATFTLFDPLPAGTTAQVSISAQFPPGTTPGTTAENIGTMTATNAPPVTSNKVIVTATAASHWTVTKNVVPAAAAPQVDTPYTYRVGLTLAAGGTQNLDNVVFTDTLPAGAQFVSATDGGTFANGVVTWPPVNLVANSNADVIVTHDVTVIFPSANFPVGTKILNVVVANGAPTGQPTQELGRAERPGTVQGAGTVAAGSKKDTVPDLGPGQSDTYTITAENPNAAPLTGFQVLEDLPPQLTMVQDGQPNLTGTGGPPTITATPGGAVAVSGGAGGWTATAPAAADTLLFDFGTVPAGFKSTIQLRAGIPQDGIGRDGQPVVGGQTFQNCIDINATGTTVNRHDCTTQTVVPLAVNLTKTLTTSPVTSPGQIVSWEITVGVPATSAADLLNPSVDDCLPPGFDLVDPTNPANSVNGTISGFNATPIITRTPNGCGTNQTLIRWVWPGAFTVVRSQTGTFTLNTIVMDNAPPASEQNQVSLSATNIPVPLVRVAPVAVTSATLLEGHKEVKGDRDADFLSFPGVGNTSRGGTAVYRATIRNVSDVPVTNIIVVDDFPIPGDIGVKDFSPRDSQWQPLFGDQIQAPQAIAVSYSTQHNPCRLELMVNAPGCQPANWTTTPPSPLSSVGSIKVEYGSLVLNPNESLSFTWLVNTPPNAPVGAVAWNSFGYTATRVDNGSQLESAEPTKVGLQVEAPPTPPPPVPPPRPPLPRTGAETNLLVLIGLVLVLGGTVLVRIGRPTTLVRPG